MRAHEQAVFRFAGFTLVPSERLLLRAGQPVPLTGRAFDLLVELVTNAGHLRTKEELLERVWSGVVVEEVNLSVNVSALRKAMALEPGGAEWIETVPRQGYRFNAPVDVGDIATVNLAELRGLPASYRGEASADTAEPQPKRRSRALVLGVVALALAATAIYFSLGTRTPPADPKAAKAGAPWLTAKLSRRDTAALARQPRSANPEAYLAFIEGRYHWSQRSPAGLRLAIEKFNRAIELDPGFALAHAALADAHTTRGYLGYEPPVATFPVARPHALKAIELDPKLAQAHCALAYIKFYFDWDWAGAREEFRQAIALDPDDPTARQWHAVYLLAAGYPDEAFSEVQAAHQLDPLSLAINTDIGFHHYYNGRYPEAESQLKLVLGMKSDFLLAHLWLARTYLQMGRYDEAIAATGYAEAKLRDWPVLVTARGFAYGMAGRTAEAEAVLKEMDALSKERFVTAYGMALIHAGLGRKDEAFGWLDKAFDERSHWLVWLRLDPRWNKLRDDPRFGALVAKMKYPA